MALGDYIGRYNACINWHNWGGLAVNSNYLYEGRDSGGSGYGSSYLYRAILSGNCINPITSLSNFQYCGGITATDDYVFVSQLGSSNKVYRCPIDLSTATTIISSGSNSNQLQNPRGLYYLTSRDYLFVTDGTLHKVLVTDKNGQYITHLGSYGTAIGNFNTPVDCVVIGNYLYVCDYNNNRVQIININTWEFQSTVIPITKPCAIDAYENYLYITSEGTNAHVVLSVYKITNGVEYEQKFNQDMYVATDANRKILYPRWASLAVDFGKIYIGCRKEGDSVDNYIYLYKNELETYLDQKLTISSLGGIDCATMQIPVTHASDMMGTVRNIPILIEASGYRQDNRVEQPILIQASGFAGQFGTSPQGIRISMVASADVSGIISQIPVEMLASVNSAEGWLSPIRMTGEILKTIDATLDLAFPSFSVIASTPMIAQAHLNLDEITSDGLCGMDEIAKGICLIDIISAGGDTGTIGYAIIDSIISEGMLTEDIYITGSEALISLVSEGQAWINPNATGEVILSISANGDMAVSPSISGSAIVSVIADGQGYVIPVIRGEGIIELVAEGIYVQDSIATGRAIIDLMEAYGYIELPIMQASKLQVVSIPVKAVTLYDIQALATTNHLDTLHIANNSGLYKEDSAIDTSQITVKLPPLDVEKPLAGLTHELFISGDNDLPTVNVELENGDTFNAQVDSMAKKKGEIRVKFGKGLRGRYKIIKLTTSGKLDIDSIRYKGEKTTRIR